MTTLQHIYAVKTIFNSGIPSDDSKISNSLILHYLKVHRARLNREKLNKMQGILDTSYQSFCLDLEKVTYHDCDCTVDPDCQILRSTLKLPEYIEASKVSSLKIRFLNGRNIDRSYILSNKYSKYSNTNQDKVIKYFIDNGYVFLLNTLDLTKIAAKAVWVNPEDLEVFKSCQSNTPCYNSLTDNFPIDADLIDPLYKLTLESLRLAYQFPEDTENDSRDIKVQTK